ncbi:hypothetical protein TNCV_4488611 [Trichonephila clavipes]|nr:hypothetical protein TNCV_4488611 [Trichonephila clavipes]
MAECLQEDHSFLPEMHNFFCSGVGKKDTGRLRIENGQRGRMNHAILYLVLMEDVERDENPTKQSCFSCGFFKKRSVMSRRKQRSAFDQTSEIDRGRIVAYRDCGLSFREIGCRVG